MHHVVICIFTIPIIVANLTKLFVHLHFYLSIVTKMLNHNFMTKGIKTLSNVIFQPQNQNFQPHKITLALTNNRRLHWTTTSITIVVINGSHLFHKTFTTINRYYSKWFHLQQTTKFQNVIMNDNFYLQSIQNKL